MNLIGKIAGLSLLCVVLGCGGGTVSDNPQTVEPVDPPAKAMLESVAETGELGSAAMEIRDALQGHPKADELLSDLDELQKTANPAQVKKKAAAMAAKL